MLKTLASISLPLVAACSAASGAPADVSSKQELGIYAHSGVFKMPPGTTNVQARAFFEIAAKWMDDRPVHVATNPKWAIPTEHADECKTLFELFQETGDQQPKTPFSILEPVAASSDTRQVFAQIQPRYPDIPLNRMYTFGSMYKYPDPALKHVDCGGRCPNVETEATWSALYRLKDRKDIGRGGWLVYNETSCDQIENRTWCIAEGSSVAAGGYWAYLGDDWAEFKQYYSFKSSIHIRVIGSTEDSVDFSNKGFAAFGSSFPVVVGDGAYIFSTRTQRNTSDFVRQQVFDKNKQDIEYLHVPFITVLHISKIKKDKITSGFMCRFEFYTTEAVQENLE